VGIWDELIDDDSDVGADCDCGGHWAGVGRDAIREILEAARAHAAEGHVIKISVLV
jgi:hypothetical protein